MKKNYFLLILLQILFFNFLFAQTWNGNTSTDWDTPSNWTPATVPGSTSNAVITTNTTNKPKLANNTILDALIMGDGAGLDFNGFTLTVKANFSVIGVTLNNSNPSSDISLTVNNRGSSYFGENVINDNITINHNGTGPFYEGYYRSNIFNGNVTINFNGTGKGIIAHQRPSTFNGNLTIVRSKMGETEIFRYGYTALTGNFSYTNESGGVTSINNSNLLNPSIGGKVDITVTGTTGTGRGIADFTLSRIKNLTTGGNISVQNSRIVNIHDNSLLLSSFRVNGFTGNGPHELLRNSIAGNVSFSDAATNNSPIYTGGNTIIGNTVFTSNSKNQWYDSFDKSNTYNGNFKFNCLAGTIIFAHSDTTSFNGDLILNAVGGINFGNVIRFGGSENSVVEELRTQPIIIPKIFMDKSKEGSLTLNDTVTVSNNLNLYLGIIKTNINSSIVLLSGVTYIGGSNTSHVDGPILKIGNDAFVFPVGQANKYAPISITAPALVTDQFRAQYKNMRPDDAGYDSTKKDVFLNHISDAEFWLLDRIKGDSEVFVALSWAANRSGGTDDMATLRVARWDGSMWKNLGKGTTTGTIAMGTIQSEAAVSSFSPFTLASTTLLNPLPISISRFDALRNKQTVSLKWTTENEINFSHFEIERADSDNHFSSLGDVEAHNELSTQHYSFEDNQPSKGVNLYRLKLVDRDGKTMYSKVISVAFNGKSMITIYPNPATVYILIDGMQQGISIEINDASGKLVKRMLSNASNRYSVKDLRTGMYFIKILDKENTTISKLIIR